MKKRIERWIVLFLVSILTAIVLCLLFGGESRAFVSPLKSPIQKPKGLENCPAGCIENRDAIGYPTCNTWCVMDGDLDVSPEYVSGRDNLPTMPKPTEETRSDAYLLDQLWMGRYRMWYSPSAGRIVQVEIR
jgi:hypothetical protein